VGFRERNSMVRICLGCLPETLNVLAARMCLLYETSTDLLDEKIRCRPNGDVKSIIELCFEYCQFLKHL